jgi:hypothetical protein
LKVSTIGEIRIFDAEAIVVVIDGKSRGDKSRVRVAQNLKDRHIAKDDIRISNGGEGTSSWRNVISTIKVSADLIVVVDLGLNNNIVGTGAESNIIVTGAGSVSNGRIGINAVSKSEDIVGGDAISVIISIIEVLGEVIVLVITRNE